MNLERLLHWTSALSILLILLVLVSVRRAHIRVEYSVSWLTAAIILLALSLNRRLLYWLGGEVVIDSPPVALLLIAFFVFLVVFYRFSVRISDMKDSNIALAQRVAILEYPLRSSHEEQEKPSKE